MTYDVLPYDLTSTYFESAPPTEAHWAQLRGRGVSYVVGTPEGRLSQPERALLLLEVEAAFKDLKGDLAVRPIYHQVDRRIEAHRFISFLTCCLQVTLKEQLRRHAPRLTVHPVVEKFAALKMLDAHCRIAKSPDCLCQRRREISAWRKQETRWSFTIPTACRKA